jgi:hypothetical protein
LFAVICQLLLFFLRYIRSGLENLDEWELKHAESNSLPLESVDKDMVIEPLTESEIESEAPNKMSSIIRSIKGGSSKGGSVKAGSNKARSDKGGSDK